MADELSYMKAKQNLSSLYGMTTDNNEGVYSLFQDPVFLMFNSFLETLGIDFRKLSEHDFNMYITVFAHRVQSQLIEWSEKYHHAD